MEDNDIQDALAARAGCGQEEKATAMVGTLICEVQHRRTHARTHTDSRPRRQAPTSVSHTPPPVRRCRAKDPLYGRAPYNGGSWGKRTRSKPFQACISGQHRPYEPGCSRMHVHEAGGAWGRAPRAASLARGETPPAATALPLTMVCTLEGLAA